MDCILIRQERRKIEEEQMIDEQADQRVFEVEIGVEIEIERAE